MSIKRMSAVWDSSRHKGSDLLLLLALADFADDLGYCWPSLDTLAQKTRVSRSTVMRAITRLEESGELYTQHNRRSGNRYVVKVGLSSFELHTALTSKIGLSQDEAEAITSTKSDKLQNDTIQNDKCQFDTSEVPPVQHDPSITVKDQKHSTGTSNEVQLEQWGYKVGQVVYWWYADGNKYVPGKITRFTEHFAYIEAKDRSGNVREVRRGRNSLSHDGSTESWTRVKELPDLQREIAVGSHGMKNSEGVSGQRMTLLNTHVKELRARFGTNGSLPTADELRAAYGWQRSQGLRLPKESGKIGDMVAAYRDATQPKVMRVVEFPPPVSGCELCGGTGQLLGSDNASVPCPACAAAQKESA